MFHFMKNMVMSAVMFGMVFAQSPIIRVKQIGTWSTPEYWWRAQETVDLQDFLADDITQPAYLNNNFDSWRDDILEIEITLDDNNTGTNYITAFRFDIAFDNDLITWIEPNTNDEDAQGNDIAAETSVNAWNQGNSRVIKGSHISGWDEGDQSDDSDYSFEVVHFSNVGYTDSIQSSGNEQSAVDSDYDWLRITMVSHGHDANEDGIPDKHFGGGNGVEKQLIKLKFRINDVADNYQPHSFRIPTYYSGNTGYYTYVSDDYLLDYKVYIDGNWGTDSTNNGGARGDITLHPKLVDVEGFGRYIGEWVDTDTEGNVKGEKDDDEDFTQKSYPYWKVVFELDEQNPNVSDSDVDPDDITPFSNWYNIESIADDASGNADEDLSDDVIGDTNGTYYYMKMQDQSDPDAFANQTLPGKGFNGISYFDYTYTDEYGYYNIQLPRNNTYRVSIWPPDASDDIGEHNQSMVDRYAITNINDAIASFNFQSNKWRNDDDIEIESPSGYLVGDVDGDDVFQLNDTYFLWAYVSNVFDNTYTHTNGRTYQDWSSIDNLKAGGNAETLNYYQSLRGGDTKQRREFTVFWEDDLEQETAELTKDAGGVAWFNPTLMDAVQTGLDTLQVVVGAGTSTFDDPDVETDGDVNPDYTAREAAIYFTGDLNLTGTKVLNTSYAESDDEDNHQSSEGNGSDSGTGPANDGISADVNNAGFQTQTNTDTYYRWDTHYVQGEDDDEGEPHNGESGDNSWNKSCVNSDCNEEPDAWAYADSTDGVYDGSSRTMNTISPTELKLPAGELNDQNSVKVNMGNQVSVPLTIKPGMDSVTGQPTNIAGFEFEILYKEDELTFIDAQTGTLPGPWMTYLNEKELPNGYTVISFGALENSPNNAPEDYYITEEMVALELIFQADSLNNGKEYTITDLQFVGKYAAGNPNGDDLVVNRQSGNVRIWNRYWAFGGGEPNENQMTYVYPNPFNQSQHDDIKFQFFMEQAGNVKISIYNANGQKIADVFEDSVNQGLHSYTFADLPDATNGDFTHSGYRNLETGVYIFVMETENKIKSKKFTIIK